MRQAQPAASGGITTRHAKPSALRNAPRTLALLAAIATVSGCYNYRVAAPHVSNANEVRSVTKWAYLWGAIQEAEEDATCVCLNNGLKEVTAQRNLLHILVGTVTLGIAVPVRLEYQCAKPPPGAARPDPPSRAQCPNIVVLPVPPEVRLPTDVQRPTDVRLPNVTPDAADAGAPPPADGGFGTTPNDADGGFF
jgi:hypothetical protein